MTGNKFNGISNCAHSHLLASCKFNWNCIQWLCCACCACSVRHIYLHIYYIYRYIIFTCSAFKLCIHFIILCKNITKSIRLALNFQRIIYHSSFVVSHCFLSFYSFFSVHPLYATHYTHLDFVYLLQVRARVHITIANTHNAHGTPYIAPKHNLKLFSISNKMISSEIVNVCVSQYVCVSIMWWM